MRLDTVRLRLGLPPRHYPASEGAPACLAYLDALWSLWLDGTAGIDVSALTSRLLALPSGTDLLGEPAVTLLRAVVTDDRIPFSASLADVIAAMLDSAAALTEDPRLDAQWWARVERFRPDVRTPATRLRAALRRAAADPATADPVEIAVLSARAAAGGLSSADLAAALGEYLATRTPAEKGAMFRILGAVMQLSYPDDAGQAQAVDLQKLYLELLAPHFDVPPEPADPPAPPSSPPRRRATRS